MFCTKCGSEISEKDQFCPKCGSKNDNYSEKSSSKKDFNFLKKTDEQKESEGVGKGQSVSKKKLAVGLCVLAAAAVTVSAVVISGIRGGSEDKSRITVSPESLFAVIDGKGNASFYLEDGVRTFDGDYKKGRSTPDQKEYLLINEKNELVCIRTDKEKEEISTIAEDVSNIGAVNDTCCYYFAEKDSLYCYQFETDTATDTGIKDNSLRFSAGKNAVAALNEKGQLLLYSEGQEKADTIATVGEDVEICAVLDDASNVIWAEETTNLDIYTLKNEVPERIGTIVNKEKYRHTYGRYFDNGRSFVVYSPGGTSVLVSLDGAEVKDVSMPGVLSYSEITDCEGKTVDSQDDSIKQFYFTVNANRDSDIKEIYRWNPEDDTMTSVSGEIGGDCYLQNRKAFYINTDSDLVMNSLDDAAAEPEKITTDVDSFRISAAGEYAYVAKSGNLYYVSLKDSEYKLNKIIDDWDKNDSLYITDEEKTVFFITEKKKIGDSYSSKGTLYRYSIGNEPEKIMDNIYDITQVSADGTVSASLPVIRRFLAKEGYDYTFDVGTIEDSRFVIKTQKNKW